MPLKVTQPLGRGDVNQPRKLLGRLDKIGQDSVKHFAENFLSASTIPDFCTIEIETCNRCNNDCPFCPANRNNDTRKPTFMDEALLYEIVDQLRAMDYRGYISLFSNNEPLLDKRIVHFVEYVKKNLPNAKNCLYTNALLMTPEIFVGLVKNLDRLIIDNYDDNFELIPSLKKVFGTVHPAIYEDSPCEIELALRMKNQKLNTRAGSAPNRINEPNKFRPQSPCILPFTQMIVRPDGTVAKCCNDPLTSITLGDLNKQTLREVWRGKAYQEFRREMYLNGRQNIPSCEFCDIFGLYNYLPPSAFENDRDRVIKTLRIQKNLRPVYIFDTAPDIQEIFDQLKQFYGLELNGFINVIGDVPINNYNFVPISQVVAEGAFILLKFPYYSEDLFEFLDGAGCRYGKDYIFYTA